MKNTLSYSAWALFFAAIAAWAGILYIGYSLRSEAVVRAHSAKIEGEESEKVAYNQRVRALVADTKAEREKLDEALRLDVVSLINTLERVGTAIKIDAQVSDVSPERGAISLPDGLTLQPVTFVINAGGSYAEMMHLVSLYEHAPLPAEVHQIELEHLPGDAKAASWRVTLRIRVFTTTPISS